MNIDITNDQTEFHTRMNNNPYVIRTLTTMVEAINEVFPDNHSLHMNDEINNKVVLVIHFDDFIITNSSGGTHQIRDLFVKFHIKFEYDSFTISELNGARTTYTKIELLNSYTHSHLSSSTIPGHYGSFCMGEDAITVTQLDAEVNFTKDNFKLFLFHIEPFVQWESLEGGPYVLMSDIVTNKEKYIYVHNAINYPTIMANIYANIGLDNFDLQYRNVPTIVNNEKFENFVKPFIPNNQLVQIGANSVEYYISSNINNTNSDYTSSVFYKGNNIPVEIVGYNGEITTRVPRKILESIIKNLNNYLHLYIVKNEEQYLQKR